MRFLLDSPYLPLIAWTLGIALATQVYKRITKAAGIRHAAVVERTLPLVPVLIGVVTGVAAPHELGLEAILHNEHHAIHGLGAFFGAGLGLASSGVFRAVLEIAPEPMREALTLPDAGDDQ